MLGISLGDSVGGVKRGQSTCFDVNGEELVARIRVGEALALIIIGEEMRGGVRVGEAMPEWEAFGLVVVGVEMVGGMSVREALELIVLSEELMRGNGGVEVSTLVSTGIAGGE